MLVLDVFLLFDLGFNRRGRFRLWSFCKEQGADDLARLRTPGGYRRAMEELEEELSTLKREAAEKPTERDEKAEEIERQIEEQRNFQLKDYGMRFDGRDNG